MTGCRHHRLAGASVVLGLLASALGARAQTAAPAAPAAVAVPGAAADAGAEDRIFALVQAGKCSQARAAALKANEPGLADQIGLMCGAKPSGVASKGAGGPGGGRRGGGSGGGRRSGP